MSHTNFSHTPNPLSIKMVQITVNLLTKDNMIFRFACSHETFISKDATSHNPYLTFSPQDGPQLFLTIQ